MTRRKGLVIGKKRRCEFRKRRRKRNIICRNRKKKHFMEEIREESTVLDDMRDTGKAEKKGQRPRNVKMFWQKKVTASDPI